MEQQAVIFRLHEKRLGAVEHLDAEARRQDFDRRLDQVVQRFLDRHSQPAGDDHAMHWAIARFVRTQPRCTKGEDHVAAQMAA